MKRQFSKYVTERIGRSKKDFTLQFFCASVAAGGAGKDTSNTAVRIIDNITGLRAECQEERSQKQNKSIAFLRLVDLLAKHYEEEERLSQMDYRVADVVRSYTQKDDRVKDHRTGKEYSYKDILNGKLDMVIRDCLTDIGGVGSDG